MCAATRRTLSVVLASQHVSPRYSSQNVNPLPRVGGLPASANDGTPWWLTHTPVDGFAAVNPTHIANTRITRSITDDVLMSTRLCAPKCGPRDRRGSSKESRHLRHGIGRFRPSMTQGISANRTRLRIRPGFESANEETVYLLKFRYFTTRHTSRGAAGKGPRRRTGYEREGGSTGRSNRTRPRPERVSQIGNRSNRAWHWKRAVASTSEPCLPRRCQRGFTPGPRSRSSTGRPRVRDPSVVLGPLLGPAVHRGTAP
jgi:hypothetical protein